MESAAIAHEWHRGMMKWVKPGALVCTLIFLASTVGSQQEWEALSLQKNVVQSCVLFVLTLVLGAMSLDSWSRSKSESKARDLAELELRKIHQRYHYMIQGNRSGLWDWLDMTQEEVYWSPQLYEILGYSDGEIPSTASAFISHIHEEDRQESLEKTQVFLQSSLRFTNIIRMIRKDGRVIWVRSSGYIVRDADGHPSRMVGSLEDLTDLKEQELALRTAKEAAEKASKAKDKFLSKMSHEMRTPLTGILGYAELLGKSKLEPSQHEFLQIIIESSNALINLINSILDYAKIEAGFTDLRLEETNIHKLVSEVAKLFAINIKSKNLQFTLSSDIQSKLYRVDSFRVRQIVTNLIGNAVKFTERGSIEVTLSESDDQTIHMQVKDTGIGIPLADQTRIFEAFQQAGSPEISRFGGTGLGLSITKQLVELMGGEIKLRSSPGEGSCFEFSFKVQHIDKPDHEPEALERTEYRDISHLSVLVVEDCEVNLQLLRLILETLGVSPLLARDGEEALAVLESDGVDLVLMDVNMPKLDGLAATKKIRELYPQRKVNIIGLSANAFQEDKDLALAAGMNAYLAKPITFEALSKILVDVERHRSSLERGFESADRA